jgi:hypothetical protein
MATYFGVMAVPELEIDAIDPLGEFTVLTVIVRSLAGVVPPKLVPKIVRVLPATYRTPGVLIETVYAPFLLTTSNVARLPAPPVAGNPV